MLNVFASPSLRQDKLREAIWRLSQMNHLEIATRLTPPAMTLNQRLLKYNFCFSRSTSATFLGGIFIFFLAFFA
jgi:hypothetical protein